MQLGTSTCGNGNTRDAYALLRALLAARGADDQGAEGEAATEILAHFSEAELGCLSGELAAEAEHHGVAPLIEPLVAWLAQAAPAAVPEQVRRVFLALAARHRRTAGVREACIDELLTAFAAADIRLILLKGAALAHLIYPRPDLRPMVDIDILIEPAQAVRAAAAARALGYAFAGAHSSRLGARMHHLPAATLSRGDFQLSLEIHFDALSPNQPGHLTMAKLADAPQIVQRGDGKDGSGREGLALGHIDMLRHLARHAFEPARRIRLIHLYDLWRYPARFHAEIDWLRLQAEFPDVIVILRLVASVFGPHVISDARPFDHPLAVVPDPAPSGIGQGMVPLSEIAEARLPARAKLAALLAPPAWWLHGFYGVPPENSLLGVRAVRHPVMVARWLALRLAAAGGVEDGARPSPSL